MSPDGRCRLGEKFQLPGRTSRCVRGQVDLPRLLEGGVDAQVLAIFVGEEHRNAPLRRALAMIDACYREEKEGQYHSLDADQLRAVAANGGVICAMGVFKDDLSAVVEQIQHIARVAGIDHVGFGADYYGLDAAPKGLEDATKYPALTEALLAAGFDSRDAAKIMGGNLVRVFGDVLPAPGL